MANSKNTKVKINVLIVFPFLQTTAQNSQKNELLLFALHYFNGNFENALSFFHNLSQLNKEIISPSSERVEQINLRSENALGRCDDTGCNPNTDIHLAGPKQIRTGRTTNITYLNDAPLVTTVNTVESNDNYGLPLHSKSVTTGASGLSKTTHIYREYAAPVFDIANRQVAKVTSERECFNNTSGCTGVEVEKHIRFYYDGNVTNTGQALTKGEITKKETWLGGSLWAPETFVYYTDGNLKQKTDPKGISVDLTYESDYNQFVATKTTSSGAKSVTLSFNEYDTGFGKVTETVDENGLKTILILDSRGRVTSNITSDNGTIIGKTLASYFESNTQNYIESCRHYGSSFSDTICSREYKDGFGRVIRKITQSKYSATPSSAMQDSYVSVKTLYNSKGQKWKTSIPYSSGSDISGQTNEPADTAVNTYTTLTYDDEGRVTRVTLPDNTFQEVSVEASSVATSLIKTTETDRKGIQKVTYSDLDKQPIEITEAFGTTDVVTTKYFYETNGLLKKVEAPQGNTTLTYQPVSNWQLSITTPNAGTTSYTYNTTTGNANFAELNVETRPAPNGSGNINITHEYNDAFGRLTKQIYSTGEVANFTYDETTLTYGKGRLTSSNYSESGYTIAKQYAYDILGNSSSTITDLSHSSYTLCANPLELPCHSVVSQNFDELGRKKTITYPDMKSSTFSYYGGTSLVQDVNHNSKNYASYNSYNINGKLTKKTFADSSSTTYSYDLTKGVLDSLITKDTDNNDIQNLSYAFDNVGNIQTITDTVQTNASYTYTYDNLNRIKKAVRGDGKTINYAFDPNDTGNLITKGNRTQTFNGTQIHLSTLATSGGNIITSHLWNAAGNLSQKSNPSVTFDYSYTGQNMLSQSTETKSSVLTSTTNNIYDETGQRYLKTYARVGKELIRTYNLGSGFEIREKWSAANGSKLDFQYTKYIYGTDGAKIASITGTGGQTVLASANFLENYNYAMLGITSVASLKGLLSKINYLSKYLFYATANSKTLKRHGNQLAIILLSTLFVFILYFYFLRPTSTSLRESVNYRSGLAKVTLGIMFLLFTSIGCNFTDPDNQSGGYLSVDFNDIYSGLPSGTVFYHSNHLGSSTVITDGDSGSADYGKEKVRTHYLPYGEIDQNLSGKWNQTTNSLDQSTSDAEYALLGIRYTGQTFDPEQDLYYYNARYYAADTGTFTTADTVVDGVDRYSGYNRYMYVGGNPIKYTDPTGHIFGLDDLLIGIGILVVGLIAGCAGEQSCRGAVEDSLNDLVFNNETNHATNGIPPEQLPENHDDSIYIGATLDSDGHVGFYTEINGERFDYLLGEDNGEVDIFTGSDGPKEGFIDRSNDNYDYQDPPKSNEIIKDIYDNNSLLSQAYHIGNTPSGIEVPRYSGAIGDVDITSFFNPKGWLKAGIIGFGLKRGFSKGAKGLITPSKYFGNKTVKQSDEILRLKYGAPRGGGKYNNSYYNSRTGRTYNVHKDPTHRGGRGHIDIRRRSLPTNYYKERPFFLLD